MTKEELEIAQKYALTDNAIENIKKTVISVLSYDKMPSDNPLMVVVGGQSGAGKTALINHTAQMSSKRDFIQIDNDFFRGFHPKAEEIKKLHPQFYTAATDQIGLGITADIIEYFMKNKYDIILHQTLKNNRIADDAITNFRNNGYTVGIRAFAVPYFESKMSQIERCLGQIECLGFCRYVRKVDHDSAIDGLPKTIDYIEKNKKYDFIEIYKRSNDISKPTLVYSKFNPTTRNKTLKTISNCENISHTEETFGFMGAKDAVEKIRYQESINLLSTLDERIDCAEKNPYNNPEMQDHIDELKNVFETFKRDNRVLCNQDLEDHTPVE